MGVELIVVDSFKRIGCVTVLKMSSNKSMIPSTGRTFPLYDNATFLNYAKTISSNSPMEGPFANDCVRVKITKFFVIMTLLELPVNFLLLKILVKNFRLELPRHLILLSLAASDYFQIAFMAFLQLIGTFSGLKATDPTCQIVRKSIEVTVVVTTVTTSGSILALSIERYMACIHCFRAHEIVSEKRVLKALGGIWGFGIICSLCDEKRYEANLSQVAFPLTRAFKILYTIVVLTSSVVLLFIQFRLYRESHRLIRVNPATGTSFGSDAEANDMRRSQLKVSFVASIVIVMYVVCMCPLAFYIVVTEIRPDYGILSVRQAVICFNQINTFADPFVYGFGMSDTRRGMMREIREIRESLSNLIGYFQN